WLATRTSSVGDPNVTLQPGWPLQSASSMHHECSERMSPPPSGALCPPMHHWQLPQPPIVKGAVSSAGCLMIGSSGDVKRPTVAAKSNPSFSINHLRVKGQRE